MKTEYAIDPRAFRDAERRGLTLRMGIVAALLLALALAVYTWIPGTYRQLAWPFALTVIVVYAAVEVSSLKWTRRLTPKTRLHLGRDELECFIGLTRYRIAYRELSIARVVERDGQVRRIDLKTSAGARLRLAGFEQMNDLAAALGACLVGARADSDESTP